MSDSASRLAADHLSPDAVDDAVLISRSRRTPECFALLFDRHAPALYRYVARRLGRDACDDLVAETFMVAFGRRESYDTAHADARPWLYGIATKLIWRHRRDEVRYLRVLARLAVNPAPEPNWYHGPDSNGPLREQGFTAAGQPVYDWVVVQAPTLYTSTLIDYQARIWWRTAQHVTPWTPPASALTCGDVASFAINMDPTYWAAGIRKALSCGQYTTSGTERVDGVKAIKLTPVRPGDIAAVLWVDPRTYLPLRVTLEFQGRPGGESKDVQWLPPTAANLADLTAPVPPGFVKVPAPASGWVGRG